jgi:hypothetical protein
MSNKRNDCFIKCSPIFVFTSHGTKFSTEVSKILIDGYDKCYKYCINESNKLDSFLPEVARQGFAINESNIKKRKDDTIGGYK